MLPEGWLADRDGDAPPDESALDGEPEDYEASLSRRMIGGDGLRQIGCTSHSSPTARLEAHATAITRRRTRGFDSGASRPSPAANAVMSASEPTP